MHRLYISSLNTEGDRTKNMALEGHKISSYIKLPYYLTFICCLGRTLLGAFKDIRTLLKIAVSRAHYWVLQRSSLFDGLVKNTKTTPIMYLVKEFFSFNWQAHLHGKIIQRDCEFGFSSVEMKHWKKLYNPGDISDLQTGRFGYLHHTLTSILQNVSFQTFSNIEPYLVITRKGPTPR